jgi:hypothetical protein
MRGLFATKEKPWDRLAAELSGRGVPSLERALVEMRFRPVHQPLREAVSKGHADYLATAKPKDAAIAFEEKLGHLIDGLLWMLEQEDGKDRKLDRAKAIAPARARFDALPARASSTLLAWLHVDAFLGLIAAIDPGHSRSDLVSRWELAIPLVDAFRAESDEWESQRRAALVLVIASLPSGTMREIVHAALDDARARTYLNVHQADGATWLVKERLDELARAVADREIALARLTPTEATKSIDDLAKLAEREGFQADKIAAALSPATPPKRKPSATPPAPRR